LKITDPDIHYTMLLIKGIARTRPGDLAESCGNALWTIAQPLAVKIIVEIEGLEPELFEKGSAGQIEQINRGIRDYNLENLKADRRFPDYLSVTTDNDMLLCMAVIKHLGNPIGLAAALSDFRERAKFPLEESLYLTAAQLGARIHAILSPGGRNALEITGRRLLAELSESGVKGISIGSIAAKGDWATIIRTSGGIEALDTGDMVTPDIDKIRDGDVIDSYYAGQIWPGQGIDEAIWITDLPGYIIIVGFADKKGGARQARTAIKSAIEKLAAADVDYIVKSFEKLKADFRKLVKSERAAAITETAVTVNHEINNPLTAILGNTQLLLMNEKNLSGEMIAKLKTIEKSAIQIRETTAKLMSIVEPVRTPYASGLNMIDIDRSKKKEK